MCPGNLNSGLDDNLKCILVYYKVVPPLFRRLSVLLHEVHEYATSSTRTRRGCAVSSVYSVVLSEAHRK